MLGYDCVMPGEDTSGAAFITPGLVQSAFEELPLPSSEMIVQPADLEVPTNLPAIFHTEQEAYTETITLLGVPVTLDIYPVEFTWLHGDGTSQVSTDPGEPWQEGMEDGEIQHPYTSEDVYSASVDTTWGADYSVNGGASQPVPGTVTIAGDAVAITVNDFAGGLTTPQ